MAAAAAEVAAGRDGNEVSREESVACALLVLVLCQSIGICLAGSNARDDSMTGGPDCPGGEPKR